jgi:hypothetical protein
MPIKINSTITKDQITPSGRHITIEWFTDNVEVNLTLNLPRLWHKQFGKNVKLIKIRNDFKDDVRPLVKEARSRLKNTLQLTTFEDEV